MGFESTASADAGDVLAELVAEITGDMVRVRLLSDEGTEGLLGGEEIVVVIDDDRILGTVLMVEDDRHATVMLDRVAL